MLRLGMSLIAGGRCATRISAMAFGIATSLPACTVVVQSNQAHFRGAANVYLATALDAGHSYLVSHAWRGKDAGTVVLSQPVGDGCEEHVPSVPGREYLLTIYCEQPNEIGSFDCERRADPIAVSERRLRFLEHAFPTTPVDVLDLLDGWNAGRVDERQLLGRLAELAELADVDDWETLHTGEVVSPVLAVIHWLDEALNGRNLDESEVGCVLNGLEERLPTIRRFLIEPILDHEIAESFDAARESLFEACDP